MKQRSQKKFVHYDPRSDVFYIGKKGIEEEYVEVAPGVHVELDEGGAVIGVEIMRASEVMKPLLRQARRRVLEPVVVS